MPYPILYYSCEQENATTWNTIMGYENITYFVGQWKSWYDEGVAMVTNVYYGSQRRNYLRNQAQVVDMVLTQPIV